MFEIEIFYLDIYQILCYKKYIKKYINNLFINDKNEKYLSVQITNIYFKKITLKKLLIITIFVLFKLFE